jgi:hypothetical protein
MLKKLLAVIAAAACAAVIVGFIPTPTPADAAKAPQAIAVDVDQPAVLPAGSSSCAQGWPNYDQTCLRDARRPNGKARVARVVVIDRSVADRALRGRNNKH